MKFFIALTIVFSASAVSAETQSVENVIEKMVKENIISESEAVKLKRKSPWTKYDKAALKAVARGPASVSSEQKTIEEVPSKDLEVAQFRAIQNEMRRILHR